LNVVVVSFIVLILSLLSGDGPEEHRSMAPYILLPAIYLATLGLVSLWNFFGEEQILINVKTIIHRKSFGFFAMPYATIPFRKLRSTLKQEKEFNGKPYGTISFYDNTQLDIPVCIFSSSVYVPMDVLEELTHQLEFVFRIEHLSQTADNSVN
jgi:hypothetical protein